LTDSFWKRYFASVNKVFSRFNIRRIGMTYGLLVLLVITGCTTVENQPIPAPAPASVTTVPEIKPAPQEDTSTLKVSNTPLGMYDQKVIESIKNNWTELVSNTVISDQQPGLVKVTFRIHSDGSMSDLKITESTANAVLTALSQMAVGKSVPFPPWSESLREELGKDYRDSTFTFRYNFSVAP
jgi:outer membrane biosynthesis protein TonB